MNSPDYVQIILLASVAYVSGYGIGVIIAWVKRIVNIA